MTDDPDPTPLADLLQRSVEQVRAAHDAAPERPPSPVVVVDDGWHAEQRERARVERWAKRIPARFRDAQLEDLDRETARELFDWAAEGARSNIVIIGAVGVGKTHAAVVGLRLMHDQGANVMFRPVVELLDELRPGGDGNLDALGTCDVLLLDDMGTERPTDWTAERLYALVNRRWLEQRPTIVTANLAAQELRERIGERMYSRLAHDALAIQLGGPDRRREQ